MELVLGKDASLELHAGAAAARMIELSNVLGNDKGHVHGHGMGMVDR